MIENWPLFLAGVLVVCLTLVDQQGLNDLEDRRRTLTGVLGCGSWNWIDVYPEVEPKA